MKGGTAKSGAVVHIVKKTGATAQSWTLEKTKAGVVIAIDPGHGGSDSGAAANGLRECDLTWAISQACAKQLRAYGYDVYITRGQNESVSVKDRVTRAKAHDAEAIFSMHINAGGGHGAVVLVPNSSSYNKQFYTMGQKFANTLLPKINKLGISTWSDGAWERNYATYEGADENQYYKGGGYADYYGIVRYARLLDMFGVIIEHGFIDSSDANILRQNSVQSALGKADAEAIYQLIGL